MGGRIIPRDIRQLARACQTLLRVAGLDSEALWNDSGPSKRASWLKGYLRRPGTVRGSSAAIEALSPRERTILLVAFDLWNESGGVPFAEVLGMSPRLVAAIATFMEARCQETPHALEGWIARWSQTRPA